MRAALVALLVTACHDADAPVAPLSAPAASAESRPVASAVPTGEKTPESCAAAVAGKPDFATCKWSVEKRSCVCNGCLADADCSAKPNGACATLPAAKATAPAAKVCLYPGEDCFAGAMCGKGRACNHDGMGRSGGCGGQGDFKPR